MKLTYNDKQIGTLKDDIFRKRVQKSRHLFRMLDAWGIQYSAVEQLHEAGCKEIRILDTDDDIVYSVPFETFWSESVVQDWGDGQQAFLPRNHWKYDKKAELQVRNQKEDLIAQIVERTTEKDKKELAKRLAIAYNALKWDSSDLHALLAKANSKDIKNYTAFVKWSCAIRNK